MTVSVKNTDRASRPAVLSDGSQIDPGSFGDAPDDATTDDLIANGWLTPVQSDSEPPGDEKPHHTRKTAAAKES